MHPSRAKRILRDEEILNVLETAEAVQEDARLRAKKDKPKSKANSIKAHTAWLSREQEKESWRQKLKEVWNKHKNS